MEEVEREIRKRNECSHSEDLKSMVSVHFGPVLDIMNQTIPAMDNITKAAIEKAAISYKSSSLELNSISHELRKVLQTSRMESDLEISSERRKLCAERMQLEGRYRSQKKNMSWDFIDWKLLIVC